MQIRILNEDKMNDYKEHNLFSPSETTIVCEKAIEYTLSATRNELPSTLCTSPDACVGFAKQFYHDDISIYESAFLILLNRAMQTIGWVKISQGGITSTVVDIKLVAKYAIESLACAVVYVHNHPSGKLQPSVQDDNLTRKLKEGLAILDVKLADAIILSPQGAWYSYMNEGRL